MNLNLARAMAGRGALESPRYGRAGNEKSQTNKGPTMKMENAVRIMAGTMVLLSLALAHWVSQWWLLLTAFVGVNLIQSAFTGFCPAEIILRKLGVGKDGASCCQ
jgi:DUF2892 family protein